MNSVRLVSLTLLAIAFTIDARTEDAAPLVKWDLSKGNGGWKAVTDCKLATKDGRLVVTSTGQDPHFTTEVGVKDGWKLLRIHASFNGRLNGQLFWGDEGEPGFSEARSVRFEARSRGDGVQKIDVYFELKHDLTALRIDPMARKGRIEIESIELFDQAPPPQKSTPADQIRIAAGFEVELLYSVPDSQGSWVSLTTDPQGRLITSDQYGKLYRIIVPPKSDGPNAVTIIEELQLDLGMAQGLCWAFDSLYVMVNGEGAGLYRVRDTNGDGNFDEVKLLRAIRGGGEHGPHAVIPGPDGESLYICGGNHTEIPDPETSRVPRKWGEDQLLPRMWDAGGHAVGKMAPGGWIAKTDPDGESFELVCTGFRNEYDLAFNTDGELFTYDADMEWDVGSPWYRPTRLNHAVSGAEFGWRSGTGKWPDWYPDSLGSVVDIGPGSPTGIAFGTGAKFPAKYQKALFICDWSYSILYAVHMTPDGASYSGELERFASGTPLQLTDLVINPKDGAMYFTIGGRRTQSGLYRVTYVGDESTTPPPESVDKGAIPRALRHRLESLHHDGEHSKEDIDFVKAHLGHPDRHIRYAARIALEHMPVFSLHLAAVESDPDGTINKAIAMVRGTKSQPVDSLLGSIVGGVWLSGLEWDDLNHNQKLALLRAYGLAFIRLGDPDRVKQGIPVGVGIALKALDPHYPADSFELNRELCQLLIYLNAPDVVGRTLKLLADAPTQEEQIWYAMCLRVQKDGWSKEQHAEYFGWFNKAAAHRGGHSFSGFLKNFRDEAVARLSDEEKVALQDVLAATPDPAAASIIEPRELVKKWTVQDLLPAVQTKLTGRDFENGRRMFSQAACFKCHQFGGQGGIVGPVLTAAGRRYNDRNLLENLIEPSKAVSDQYQATTFVLDSGLSVTGRIVNLGGKNYQVSENMLDPGKLTSVNRDEILEMIPSRISMMPAGLLDTLTEDEILDLVAYLRSGGDRQHAVFQ